MDITEHHTDDALGDRQTQSAALEAGNAAVLGPEEWLKEAVKVFFPDTVAIVLKSKFIAGDIKPVAVLFFGGYPDGAALGGVADGVVRQTHEYLLDSAAVADKLLMVEIVYPEFQRLVLVLSHRSDEGNEIVQKLRQGEFLVGQIQITGFDTGYIENFIYQEKQLLSGTVYLAQAVLDPVLVVQMGTGDGGNAEDVVHGGTKVVAHADEEVALGCVGAGGVVQGGGESFLHFQLLTLMLIDDADGEKDAANAVVFILFCGDQTGAAPAVELVDKLHEHTAAAAGEAFLHGAGIKEGKNI